LLSAQASWDGIAQEIGLALRDAPARAGKTRVVAIDGRSGAGKTTLAKRLRAQLPGTPLVALEDLYGGWDGLEDGISLLVGEVLRPLAAGRAARVPRYDWVSRGWAEQWVLQPPEFLVVEGVGAGARAAARYESLLVWIAADGLARKQRALERDGELYAMQWDRWAVQEDRMLAREKTPARADFVVDGLTGTMEAPQRGAGRRPA
jgi:para-aminobenzoate synthetase